MYKNTASQQWIVFAFQDEGGTNPGEPVTGDALNITANLYLDGSGVANAVDDLNPTELGGGYYAFGITAVESNANNIVIAPVSATANVNVIGTPGAVYPVEPSGPRKNTALADMPFYMVDATDGVTPETGLTVTVEVSKDGGVFAAGAGTVTEIANGAYHYDAAAADMNADVVLFKFTATGARAALLAINTVA